MTSFQTPRPTRLALTLAFALASASGLLAAQGSGQSAGPNIPRKDIALDTPAPGANPGRPAAAAPVTPGQPAAAGAHQAATQALHGLGLKLLRADLPRPGQPAGNQVVSSLSLASALGLVQAGTRGPGAQQINGMLGKPPAAGGQLLATQLPALLEALAADGQRTGGFVMANRVWLGAQAASAVPASYTSTVQQRFQADAQVLNFTDAATALQTINQWGAQATQQRITQLMPDGSVDASTRVVVTNAIHFKSPWAQPFDPGDTRDLPFLVQGRTRRAVPTMVDERSVRMGRVGAVTVMELPFADGSFTLVLGVPPAGQPLDSLVNRLDAKALAGWTSRLAPTTCRLELPRFEIQPVARPLKPLLQALGMTTVFGPGADLSPLLGSASRGVQVDNVFHSASITIDEQGGEAAATTGSAMSAKSFSLPAPACAVDRPFVFAVLHKASGAPLFIGRVMDPQQR